MNLKTQETLQTVIVLVLCLLTSFSVIHTAYARQGPPNLLNRVAAVDKTALPPHALAGQASLVQVNPAALQASHLTLDLPGNRNLVVQRQRKVSGDGDTVSWIGHVQGDPGSLVVFTSHQGVVAGSISLGNALYELIPDGHGRHLLFRVDETTLPDDGPHRNVRLPAASDETGTASSTTPSTSQAETGYIIDLLVVYTPASRNRYGQAGIEAKIVSAVEAANQAYLNSAIDKQLNIVYMGEVSYTESGDMGDALTRLRSASDGYIDEVHTLRNTYGADLVAMVDEDSNYCGIAYVMAPESSSFSPWAFSVVFSSCLSNQTLAHELGHNEGNMHDRANSSNTGAYPYSYGYRRCVTDGSGFRTIMSYSCTGGTRINYFSNPNVLYNGFATGIDYDVDAGNSADTARSMNNTADTVAAFRVSTMSPPSAPADLSAIAVSYDQIDLVWTETSGDETGFQVERSSDEQVWNVVATLGSNATSYSDTGLTPSMTYFYRVRAYNGAGNSSYTNVASATTDAPPAPPLAPMNLTALVASGSQIDLGWNDVSSNEDGFRIERAADGQAWSVIASLPPNVTGYSDTGLQLATTYTYQVIAYNIGGDSPPSNVVQPTTLAYTDYPATGEIFGSGSVSGDYMDTWDSDGIYEGITEQESGGKPSKRYSLLEHTWEFDIGSGFAVTLYANASCSAVTDGDTFLFQFSVDGVNFDDIFELTGDAPNVAGNWALPAAISGGMVYIRVIDTDRLSGHRSLDTVAVDELFLRVENDPNGTLPAAPSDLNASAVSANQVTLAWIDNGGNASGIEVERSTDNASWDVIDNVSASVTTYDDMSAMPETTFYYRVSAYNGAGISEPSNIATATTPQGTTLTLSATGYKIKGVQHIDLVWSGASTGDVDIIKDGSMLTTVSNTGTYTDNTRQKGSATYTYQVCEANSQVCSDPVEVVF